MSIRHRNAMEITLSNSEELQLICNCCGQPYYPDKAWEDKIRAIVFGAEKYAICPLCTQSVPDDVYRDEGYRRRCRHEVTRLQRMFESETARKEGGSSMAEPTYEELKARLAELEAKHQQRGQVNFKVSDKGGVSVYGLGRFPVTLYYEQWVRLLGQSDDLKKFLEENKNRLKLKGE